MKRSPFGSFIRFSVGFVTFVGVSLCATLFTAEQVKLQEQQKAASAALLQLIAHN